jgi:dTDP-4-amino-4,6-dideoxygalactose transaminase
MDLSKDNHDPEIRDAINTVVASGKYILGEQVDDFESEFTNYIKYDHRGMGVGLGNGFDALVCSMNAMFYVNRMSGYKPHVTPYPNGEVVVPSNAPLPVWMAVTASGFIPVAASFDDATLNVTAESVWEAFSFHTVAVIVVHLYGRPAPVCEIIDILKGTEVSIIEDCCQAHGSHINGRKVGTFGDIAAFSFYPTKNLGCIGDGGFVYSKTNEPIIFAHHFRQYGEGYWRGINSRLDELQAAILRVKLRRLDGYNVIRRRNADLYCRQLSELDDMGIIKLPQDSPGHVYHQFVVQCKDRSVLANFLKRMGIDTGIHYPVYPGTMRFYENPAGHGFVRAQILSDKVLSLPIAPHVSPEDIEYICDKIKEFYINAST